MQLHRYVVPENYLEAKVEKLEAKVEKLEAKVEKLEAKVEKLEAKVEKLDAGVMNTGNNQNMLDEVYESALRRVKSSWEAEAQDHSKLVACVAEIVGHWM